MAADVFVPGTELEDAKKMISFDHDNIDLDANQFDFRAAFGSGRLYDAAENFEDAWNDGREQVSREIDGVRDAIGKVLDTMDKTDTDAAANLSQGQ